METKTVKAEPAYLRIDPKSALENTFSMKCYYNNIKV